MWYRSPSFILDTQQQLRDDAVAAAAQIPESRLLSPATATTTTTTHNTSSMAETLQNPNPNVSAYYQTRAAHHGVVTSDWLAQAQAAVGRHPDDLPPENSKAGDFGKAFSVVDEFNNWRKQPDLAEAVAAIRALASVIRSSEATTMMELEIELKKASDSLKVRLLSSSCDFFPLFC